jgi:energy-converting hydrogenase B subunit I
MTLEQPKRKTQELAALQRRRERARQIERNPEMTLLVRVIVRGLLPILLIFGAYIITYGHLTAGGGFQGGMIIVGTIMSFYLAYGYNTVRRFQEEDLDLTEHASAMLYLILGLIALFAAGNTFLTNVIRGGTAGTLFSGGIIFVLNVIVGVKVAAGTLLVLLILLQALQKGE